MHIPLLLLICHGAAVDVVATGYAFPEDVFVGAAVSRGSCGQETAHLVSNS